MQCRQIVFLREKRYLEFEDGYNNWFSEIYESCILFPVKYFPTEVMFWTFVMFSLATNNTGVGFSVIRGCVFKRFNLIATTIRPEVEIT